jgi:DNA-binding transcriptional MocR family regulator
VVITENPCFIGAISAFRSYEAKLESIPLDQDGIDVKILEATMDKYPEAKMLYLTPYFHNPAGIIYSNNRKMRLSIYFRNTIYLYWKTMHTAICIFIRRMPNGFVR